METYEVKGFNAASASAREIEIVVEQLLLNQGLIVSLKGTLSKHSGSIHWHLIKLDQKGTLELTWWPVRHKLWFQVQSGRKSAWITELLPELLLECEKTLADLVTNRSEMFHRDGKC